MTHLFQSSRLTDGNLIFPVTVMIDEHRVRCCKSRVFGREDIIVPRNQIASVHVRQGILFADIILETFGGRSLLLPGFLKEDARRMSFLLNSGRRQP